MNKNTQVETAQKSQATNKDKTPTGKIKTIKTAEARRKEREENYRNFRINALRRRCDRMGYSKEETEEYVKKLIEQLNAPKEYSILILFDGDKGAMFKEALKNANLKYKFHSDTYFFIDGNQDILAKIREIAPAGAKIYPYAKKMGSVLPKQEASKKKPTSNTAKAKNLARISRKTANRCISGVHKKGKGKFVAKVKKRKTLLERKKQRKAINVQMVNKKPSESLKTTKKAA